MQGIQSKGIYVKHFAFNDQETMTRCYSIFSNEQAMREVYLDAFEYAITEGGAKNVMNSFDIYLDSIGTSNERSNTSNFIYGC